MSVKIDSLEIENVKRVKAVQLEPAENGLTVIGGRNGQGKTSVLDSIAWALGGNRRRPTDAKREGSATDPRLKVVLSNGLVVERKGKNSDLKVTDPSGGKSGQQLLDGFVEELALDLPRFLASSDKEKALTLLNILGIGDELAKLEAEEQRLYNQRLQIGQMAKQKRGAAEELPVYPEAPSEPVNAAELIMRQQEILARNGENQRKRSRAEELGAEFARLERQRKEAEERLAELTAKVQAAAADLATARMSAEDLRDESTAEVEESISRIDELNAKVRANQMHADAERAADELDGQYADLDGQVSEVRSRRLALLDGADMPIDGLSVENGDLLYRSRRWDCMSGSEQLQVATAIVRRLKPECGFVLVDKLEQMDRETLSAFGEWAEAEGLQVIATRVSTGDECSIVIEDGYAAGSPRKAAVVEPEFEEAVQDMASQTPTFSFPGKE